VIIRLFKISLSGTLFSAFVIVTAGTIIKREYGLVLLHFILALQLFIPICLLTATYLFFKEKVFFAVKMFGVRIALASVASQVIGLCIYFLIELSNNSMFTVKGITDFIPVVVVMGFGITLVDLSYSKINRLFISFLPKFRKDKKD
jgi:hypothetical protein